MTSQNSKSLLAQIQQQQKELKARLDQEQDSLSELAKRLWAQQESEKARLSRELHDGVGQLLTGLTRRLQTLSEERPELAELATISELALADVRQLSRLISPTILDDLGLIPALTWLCRSLFEHEKTHFEHQFDVSETPSKELSVLIFRIVQESLVNILKHSQATEAKLLLSTHHKLLRVDIVDNGCGFDLNCVENGIGLTSMKDRARAFDAQLVMKSAVGKGTTITLTVPL